MSKLETTKQSISRLLSHCDPALVFAGIALARCLSAGALLWQDVALFAVAMTAWVTSGLVPEPRSQDGDEILKDEISRLRDEQSKIRTTLKMSNIGGDY